MKHTIGLVLNATICLLLTVAPVADASGPPPIPGEGQPAVARSLPALVAPLKTSRSTQSKSSRADLFVSCNSIATQRSFDVLSHYFADHPGNHWECLALSRSEFVFTTDSNFQDCRIEPTTKAFACNPLSGSRWYPNLDLLESFSGAGKSFALFRTSQLKRGDFGESYEVFYLVPKRRDPRGYRVEVLDGSGAQDQSDSTGECASAADLQAGEDMIDVVRAGSPPFEILRDGHSDVTIRFNQQTVRCATGEVVDSTISYRWSGDRFAKTTPK